MLRKSLWLLILLNAYGCGSVERQVPPAKTITKQDDTVMRWQPSQTFKGKLHGAEFVFEHKNHQEYRLKQGDQKTGGKLNTERGYKDDANATVFVLDPDKPESEQKYLVRMSNGSFLILNPRREVNAELEVLK
jgi:hypothetical protein